MRVPVAPSVERALVGGAFVSPSKWCTARHQDPDVTCELKSKHEGFHRAEYGPPIPNSEPDQWGRVVLIAQVVSWG